MKVLYFHQYFVTPDKAGGTRSYEIARRMVAAGHEVHMITSWREPTDLAAWREEDVDGIRVHWLPVRYDNAMRYADRMKAFAAFAWRAAGRGIAIGGDVVFSTSTPLTIALPGIRTARKLSVPHVFEVRDLWPDLPIAMGALKGRAAIHAARALERFAYRNSEHVVALSPGMADGVAATGYPRDRITVAPNSCDLDLFRPDPAAAAAFRAARPEISDRAMVLYAGTFGHINGVEYLADLAAAARTRHPDLCFVAIGDGARADAVRAHADAIGVLGDTYLQYPAMPKRDLVAAFHAAAVSTSLFIDLPEMEANSANKFFDGLASGTPVAVNYGGWQADLLERHAAGLRLPRRADGAVDRIAALVADRQRLAAHGRNARALAESEFGRDDIARRVRKVLENQVGRRT